MELSDAGCHVSLFIDADLKQIDAAQKAGAPVIELHTGCFADAETQEDRRSQLNRLIQSAKHADTLGLQVNAGHGLHRHNVEAICLIPEIVELNIGHGIIARALMIGLDQAVREMKRLMREARRAC